MRMASDSLTFENVSFAFPGMAEPLLRGLTVPFGRGWTGIVGANGCGKTTLLRLASGELEPTGGTIARPDSCLYVVQRTDAPPEGMAEFFESADAEAFQARIDLDVGEDWGERWDSLSHGVSHDRELLDELCAQCLFLTPPTATLRPGGVTQGMEQDRREQTSARARDDAAKHAAERLRAAAQERREEGERMAARTKLAKNRLKPNKWDHDAKAERNLAKLSGKDAWAGKQAAALSRRASKAQASRAAFHVRKEFATGFWLEEADVSRRNFVLRVPAGELPLGGGRTLRFPDLEILPTDRVALTGPNGFGKTSLLRFLDGRWNVPAEHLTLVPQEITAEESARILAEAKKLPDDRLGDVMTRFSRLGSRPGRLLDSAQPSPGEVRKLLLALGIARGPHLIVMDEPTNHLDLPGILCLEDALADAPCAMLLVSHDERFLGRLARTRWALEETAPGVVGLSVRPFE